MTTDMLQYVGLSLLFVLGCLTGIAWCATWQAIKGQEESDWHL